MFSLATPDDVEALGNEILAQVGSGAVIIIDTLARATPGMDENAVLDMGIAIQAADALSKMTNGLVVLVHHTGKDASKGMRGSSSLSAAADVVIEVSAENLSGRSWRATKVKDGAIMDAHRFALEDYVVGEDEDKDPVRSCAVRWNRAADALKEAETGGKHQRVAMPALIDAMVAAQVGLAGAPAGVRAMLYRDAQKLVEALLREACGKRAPERAKEALDGLEKRNLICSGGGGLQKPGSPKRERVIWLANSQAVSLH